MVEAEGVEVKFTADDKDVNTRLDNLEKRLGRAQEKAKKGGKAAGSAFFGGFVGGAAGVIAGGAMQSGPVNAITDLLMNVLGAALLPLLQKVLPLLEAASGFAVDHPTATGGAIAGGMIAGPPGAIVGGTVGAGVDLVDEIKKQTAETDRIKSAPGYKEKADAYSDYLANREDTRNWFEQAMGMKVDHDMTAYDRARLRAIGQDQYTGHHDALPPQDVGKPYDPSYPPPNVGDLHGPTVVNTG